ncbi:MAG: sigma 54-interacting transcriptional regulator [Planctomycetota bacterium]|nr:sigma 54-interacting transcriptional regulator [Planctomycetota bacterium]
MTRSSKQGGEPVHSAPAWLAGAGPARATLVSQLKRLAAADASLLIEGESGSGKNLAARWLHEHSARRSQPLVEVDLSALTPTLIEAELFGHIEGAFTGAAHARVGRFVRAEGGTLVLDGVERLAEGLQGKLLRALQERRVEPLGADSSVAIDVRIVATSSAPLYERVRQKRFREDLYYRLAVVRLELPPLRQRVEDIASIARGLIERAGQRASVARRVLSPAALERLEKHAWPGNLRELENAIERVLVLAAQGGGPIEADEFAFLSESVAGFPERLAREALAHGVSIERLESAMFDEALRETRGNVTQAAKLVGLTRRAFDIRHEKKKGGEAPPHESKDET